MSDSWPTTPGSMPSGPPPPGPPPGPPGGAIPPGTPPPSGPNKLVIGVIVAVLAAIVLGGVAYAVLSGGDDESAIPTTTTATSEAPPTTPPTTEDTTASTSGPTDPPVTTANDPEFDAKIAELEAFVEEAQGLEFKEDVVVEVVDDQEFSDRLLVDFEEHAEERDNLEVVLKAANLIDGDVDMSESLRNLLDVGVLGFYDPETDELVVKGSELTLYTQQTIVHELVHALDDQWFDLDRPELEDAKDESSFGFSAVVEGNARAIQNQWTDSLSSSERSDVRSEELSYGAGIDFSAFPLFLVELISAPYNLGEPLVEVLMETGGLDELEAALLDPPTTSEQVINPQAFLDREPALDVSAPPADGEVVDEGVFGQMVLFLLLNDVVGQQAAGSASNGWGGDYYVAWTDGDQNCLRVDFEMDTPTDTDELEDALNDWTDEQSDASVTRTGDTLRFTTCS